jgi:hypothetical protein
MLHTLRHAVLHRMQCPQSYTGWVCLLAKAVCGAPRSAAEHTLLMCSPTIHSCRAAWEAEEKKARAKAAREAKVGIGIHCPGLHSMLAHASWR